MTVELITRYAKLLIFFAIIWVGIWAYNNHGCRKIEGPEMEPAISPESFKWVAPTVYRPDQLQRDDFIIYKYVQAGKQQQSFAARVVGLPGDKVRIVKGEVFVNEDRIRDDYVHAGQRSADSLEEMIVPRDTVFVLCDNRNRYALFDSRGIGPVGMWAILGKIR
jgi:signal peptidase I